MRQIFPYQEDDKIYYIEAENGDRLDKIVHKFSSLEYIRKIYMYNKVNGSLSLEVGDIIKIKEEDFFK